MTAVERLKRDHGRLSAKLQIVEAAYDFGHEARFVLQEVCFTFARQLHEHARQEERLAAACSRRLERYGPAELERLALDHREELGRLHLINQALARTSAQQSWDTAWEGRLLAAFADQWRARAQKQEAHLFPLLERVDGVMAEEEPASSPHRLTETMTAEEVLRQYPEARSAFERLFIRLPFEEYDRLEEIAARHGLKSPQLLAHVEAAITMHKRFSGMPGREPGRSTVSSRSR